MYIIYVYYICTHTYMYLLKYVLGESRMFPNNCFYCLYLLMFARIHNQRVTFHKSTFCQHI